MDELDSSSLLDLLQSRCFKAGSFDIWSTSISSFGTELSWLVFEPALVMSSVRLVDESRIVDSCFWQVAGRVERLGTSLTGKLSSLAGFLTEV